MLFVGRNWGAAPQAEMRFANATEPFHSVGRLSLNATQCVDPPLHARLNAMDPRPDGVGVGVTLGHRVSVVPGPCAPWILLSSGLVGKGSA